MARRSCYAFHIQHWSDGRRSRSEHEGRQYCGQRFVFSHVDLLRGHSPIRGDADSIAEDCRYSTADTGDQIVESGFSGLTDRSCLVVMVALIIICGGIAVKFFKWE